MLSAEAVCKQYARRPALGGVSLQAEGGEVVGIAGANGSGKSTLLSVLTGLVAPDGGAVRIEGEPPRPRALRKWLGYVPQADFLFDGLSARDNIKLWAAAYGADWGNALPFLFPAAEAEDERQAFLRKKAGVLSGGMRKRLSIAIALLHGPKYLVMDEPTAGLDAGFRYALLETVNGLRAAGKCVVFTSHQAEELLWCDRIYVLKDGVFIYEGSAEAVRGGTEALYALITGTGRALC